MSENSKQFLQGLSLMLLVNLIVKPLWILFVDPAVQQQVGNYNYGIYYSTLNFVLMGNMLLDFGLSNTWLANSKAQDISAKQIIKIKFLFSIAYVIVIGIAAWLLGLPSFAVLVPLAFLQIANSFLNLCRYFLQQKKMYKADSTLSVLDRIIASIIIMAAIFVPFNAVPITITNYAYIQMLAIVISIATIVILFLPKKNNNKKLDLIKVRKVLQSALPYAAIIVLMAVLLRADVFFIKQLHPNAYNEVAEYAYGFRILDALNNFGYLVASYAFVFFATHITDKIAIKKTSTTISWVMLLGAGMAIVIVAFFGATIAQLLYKTTTPKIYTTMLWCTIAFAGSVLVHIYSSLLTAAKAFSTLIYILVICIITMAVLHVVFTKTYGAIAAAYITAFTQILFGVGCFVACKLKRLV